ncbi:MAG: GtrA family protein [Reyranella sp.]|nr:GtrA family protein [Reyranella sp.]MDP3160398.1 GtrA family protein [Reyranella sp.]
MAVKTDEMPAPRPIALVALARSALASPILRFLIVGGGNTLLYAVLSLLFMWLLPFSKQVSSTLAYLAGIPVAFLAYKTFVFRAGSATSHSEILKFLVTHSINLVMSYAMVAVLCGGFGLPREVGVLASCAAFAIIGYILMKLWVFRSSS